MTTRDIPFGSRPFAVAAGSSAGLGRGAMAGSRFARPFHGVRQLIQPPDDAEAQHPPTSRELLRRQCQGYAVRLRPGQFFSHETALVLRGAPAPTGWKQAVHVSAHRPTAAPRTRGVAGHRLAAREPASSTAFGFPVEHPARAWVQTSRLWKPDDLIAAAEFLVLPRRGLATIEELAQEAARMRGGVLDIVLDQVRVGSESPKETELRLLLVRAGLPEPELNIELRTASGDFVARLDQAFRRFRVAVEYDGRQHAESAEQFARDGDRWDAIRAEGWELVRILHHHLRPNGAVAVSKVTDALRRAGWSPGT